MIGRFFLAIIMWCLRVIGVIFICFAVVFGGAAIMTLWQLAMKYIGVS